MHGDVFGPAEHHAAVWRVLCEHLARFQPPVRRITRQVRHKALGGCWVVAQTADELVARTTQPAADLAGRVIVVDGEGLRGAGGLLAQPALAALEQEQGVVVLRADVVRPLNLPGP